MRRRKHAKSDYKKSAKKAKLEVPRPRNMVCVVNVERLDLSNLQLQTDRPRMFVIDNANNMEILEAPLNENVNNLEPQVDPLNLEPIGIVLEDPSDLLRTGNASSVGNQEACSPGNANNLEIQEALSTGNDNNLDIQEAPSTGNANNLANQEESIEVKVEPLNQEPNGNAKSLEPLADLSGLLPTENANNPIEEPSNPEPNESANPSNGNPQNLEYQDEPIENNINIKQEDDSSNPEPIDNANNNLENQEDPSNPEPNENINNVDKSNGNSNNLNSQLDPNWELEPEEVPAMGNINIFESLEDPSSWVEIQENDDESNSELNEEDNTEDIPTNSEPTDNENET
ncbi:ras guanine nucleotide exchange factor P-like isoform X2 [Drosophila eugracilis]|uniref:ras guanine nucleotide exchange factor P-like isoform X2 n=1 Tax=Drosophila eugracilis TaxID=29029 RepID=UPI0007E70CB9|nr:ras guanine nucleotide exchange factor P-like isoform X2 [Drosophila eugracilis]